MARATYLIASASKEEKWSSVTNGRTLILIVSFSLSFSLSFSRGILFIGHACRFRNSVLSAWRIIAGAFAIQSTSACDLNVARRRGPSREREKERSIRHRC